MKTGLHSDTICVVKYGLFLANAIEDLASFVVVIMATPGTYLVICFSQTLCVVVVVVCC